jgi:hypothetical protein
MACSDGDGSELARRTDKNVTEISILLDATATGDSPLSGSGISEPGTRGKKGPCR